MKVQPINNNYNTYRNTNFKAKNKFCTYGITSLITCASLFTLTNALGTKAERFGKDNIATVNLIASALGIIGTGLSLFGLEQQDISENNNEDK